MKLIVISSTQFFSGEAQIINDLFLNGLEIFHLRKPQASQKEIALLYNKIDPEHRSKIAIHSNGEAILLEGIHRVHYTTKARKMVEESTLIKYKSQKKVLSTSVHSNEELETISSYFDYTFFGPVFDSISKPGYLSTLGKHFQLIKKDHEVIGIGGISQNNIHQTKMMGFDGIALLGALWKNPSEAVRDFKKSKELCQQ